jgi:integrase
MAKRGANEGTIFQRKDGRWSSIIDLGWENGKRKRKTFYGKTRKEVAYALNKATREKAEGLPVMLERQTVDQFLTRWLAESVKPSVRALTHEQYEQHVRLYLKPAIGKVQLARLSPQQIQSIINEQAKRGLSPNTVRITLFVLRRALDQAFKWGALARNVAKLVERPRIERKEILPPTIEQARKLLDALKGERLEALFTIGLALGLRRGEMLGLRWEDVDFDKRTISVRQAVQRSGGKNATGEDQVSKLHIVAPKSTRSIRTIPMPQFVAEVVRGRKAQQAEERLLAGSQWKDLRLIFTTKKGTPIEPRRINTEFKRILKNAELPETIRLHDSRHFAASLLASENVHPRIAMEILGHSDINLTMKIYTHVVSGDMQEAAEKIDAALASR